MTSSSLRAQIAPNPRQEPAIFSRLGRLYSYMAMTESNLTALIAGAQAGEAACFEELVDAYADRLYGYFYRLCGRRIDAEDLLQELFVRLVRAIGNYDHRGQFDAFLFRIATNIYRDRIRKLQRNKETVRLDDTEAATGASLAANLPDSAVPAPDSRLTSHETSAVLQAALAQLSGAEREIILLRHYSDMRFQDIAELLKAPLGTVLARAHRGLAKLRELMGSRG